MTKSHDQVTSRKSHGFKVAEKVDPLIAENASNETHQKIDYGTVSHSCEKLTPANSDTVVYKRRWYILLVFSAICMLQNAIWITWNPLYQSVQIAFDWNLSDLALLTNWGCITYVISMTFFSWMMDVKGLRWSCVVTSALMAAGCALRCITYDPATAKWLIHFGHILNGLAGPVADGGASLLSSVWFPAHQRTTATAISLFSAGLGVSLSFLIGTQMISQFGQSNCTEMRNLTMEMNGEWQQQCNGSDQVQSTRHAIMLLMYCELAFSCVLFLVTLVYFPAKPPSAPSVTATVVRLDFRTGIEQLFKHTTFWKIGICFALAVGVSNGWLTFVDPMIKKALTYCKSDSYYDQTETGWLGFYSSFAYGIAGCIVARFADVFSRHMKLILLILFTVALTATVGFTVDSACYITINKAFLFTMYVVSGIGIQACTPIFYELSCENAYPIAEGITVGLLTWLNRAVGVVFLLVLMVFPGTQWMNWTMVGSIAVCIPIIVLFPNNYNRLDVDKPK